MTGFCLGSLGVWLNFLWPQCPQLLSCTHLWGPFFSLFLHLRPMLWHLFSIFLFSLYIHLEAKNRSLIMKYFKHTEHRNMEKIERYLCILYIRWYRLIFCHICFGPFFGSNTMNQARWKSPPFSAAGDSVGFAPPPALRIPWSSCCAPCWGSALPALALL